MQALVGSDGAELRSAEHWTFLLGHLEPPHAANAHAVLRTELTIRGSLAPSQARRKDTTVLVDHGLYRRAWLPDHTGEVSFGRQTSLGRLTRIELGSRTDGRPDEP